MKSYEQLMSEYKDIEFKAHVELDDVINKVTQECGEIIEAKENNDITEMNKESSDALVNVLSVSYELGINSDLENIKQNEKEVTSSKLLIDLANWNTKIGGFRNRYSRQEETIESVLEATNILVRDILSFSNPKISSLKMIENNTNKFAERVEKYLPKLDLYNFIETISDFPKLDIEFKDISPLLENEEAMRYITFEMAEKCRGADYILGLDARGFLFGERIAELLGKPFVMVRKAGKLPGKTFKIKYGLEYGKDEIELQKDMLKKGDKVALVDDLLATGGTMDAAIKLVEKAGAEVNNIIFAISLNEESLCQMQSRKNFEKYNVDSILQYN